jgi:hypothetical protein
MNEIVEKIIDGIKMLAPTVANLALPGSGLLVETLMRHVTGDGPETPIDAVAAKIEADPKLYLELQRLALEREIKLREFDSADLAAVNVTMQSESGSAHWPQWSWRPYNGFLFGTAVVLIYFVLPLLAKPVPTVPEWIWIGWGAILGVTTWDRGKEKRIQAGDEPRPGLVEGVIGAIRGKTVGRPSP